MESIQEYVHMNILYLLINAKTWAKKIIFNQNLF